jgi:hypothetical protein
VIAKQVGSLRQDGRHARYADKAPALVRLRSDFASFDLDDRPEPLGYDPLLDQGLDEPGEMRIPRRSTRTRPPRLRRPAGLARTRCRSLA